MSALLLQMQHDSKHFNRLERAVSDALRYLGFQVIDKAKPGPAPGFAPFFCGATAVEWSRDHARRK